jgi:hypothetical protein
MPLVYPDDFEYDEDNLDYENYTEEEWVAYYESMLDPDNDN